MKIELERFVEEMERILKENDYKGGWKDTDEGFLLKKLIEEFAEYFASVNHPSFSGLYVIREFINQYVYAVGKTDESLQNQRKELVDIANICMMLADKSE